MYRSAYLVEIDIQLVRCWSSETIIKVLLVCKSRGSVGTVACDTRSDFLNSVIGLNLCYDLVEVNRDSIPALCTVG